MIGVTERGPVNVPILVTSYGEYRRWFGETLSEATYAESLLPAPRRRRLLHQRRQARVRHAHAVGSAAAHRRAERLVAEDARPRRQPARCSAAPPATSSVIVVDGTGLASPSRIQIGTGVGRGVPSR